MEGALAPPCKCCKVFLCISSYSKILSRMIIHALFWQFVVLVGFWGALPQEGQDPHRGPSSPDPLVCPPLEKNPGGAHGCCWY